MKKLVAASVLMFSVATASAFGETLKGTISDSMCGAKHVKASKDDLACAQKCVKAGSQAVFIMGDKVYKIDNQDAVTKHVGHKVTLTGSLTGESIHVDSVKM